MTLGKTLLGVSLRYRSINRGFRYRDVVRPRTMGNSTRHVSGPSTCGTTTTVDVSPDNKTSRLVEKIPT